MYLSRVLIKNFRNFSDVDVALSQHVVLLGENRAGKSNFVHALRLVLDNSLPDSARYLKLSDVWDGALTQADGDGDCAPVSDPLVEIHLDFCDFEDHPRHLALLTDYRRPDDPTVARLSYVFRKKAEVEGEASSEADFEFRVFGGEDETKGLSQQVRRRLCLDLLPALRDAEADLGGWKNSPLRPLIQDAASRVPRDQLVEAADTVNAATASLAALPPIQVLETDLRDQIAKLAGPRHDIRAKLGLAPTDAAYLLRGLRLLIDDGKRGIGDASLGSANVALLALRLAEFSWRQKKNERSFTLLAVEEPEAHLHPQLQRKVFGELFKLDNQDRSLILTTHSPNIARVAPIRSVVLLRDEGAGGTKAHSLARLPMAPEALDDLQRYLDVTRAEILFARGVIFVEGDAEAVLLPVFAASLGINLDALGVSVCSVGGTNFVPYVSMAVALGVPCSVITDWDPREEGEKAYGWSRSHDLIRAMSSARGRNLKPDIDKRLGDDEAYLRTAAKKRGIFLNANTLETEIANTPELANPLLGVLSAQDFGPVLKTRLVAWKAQRKPIDPHQLMLMIGYVSKGRFASQLAPAIAGRAPPAYIADAIRFAAGL